MIWYCTIITGLQLNTNTNAAFNDVENVVASIHVSWPIDLWDKSSLNFENMETGGKCSPPYIYTKLKNDGEDMEFSTWSWELYQISGMQGGSPNLVGEALDSGVITPIKAGEIGIIESYPENLVNGKYRFIITRPDRPGSGARWSEEVKINNCQTPSTLTDSDLKNEVKTEEVEEVKEDQEVFNEVESMESEESEKQQNSKEEKDNKNEDNQETTEETATNKEDPVVDESEQPVTENQTSNEGDNNE